MPARLKIQLIEIATRMPPVMANAAESEGIPPAPCAILIAIGVVTAFGAIENATARLPPHISTKPTPATADTQEPEVNDHALLHRRPFTCSMFFISGMANATVAGPNRKIRNWVLS